MRSRPMLLLKAAASAAAGSVFAAGAPQALAEDAEASNARPQPGDLLVSAGGDKSGSAIAPDDLPLGGPQVLAWPMDPKSHTVRDGSRLNLRANGKEPAAVWVFRLAP